jgi:predicted TIM-barrel fold metal-dependent hydrolase
MSNKDENAVREDIIDPDRPICDPHHHLWDHPGSTYLLPELLADTGSGHRIVSTVFVECMAMYRAGGEVALQPLGETEFVNGAAAMMSSGRYGEMRGCAGIVSFADLLLGADVGAVLDEHMRLSPRFRGIRHVAAYDPSPEVHTSHTHPPEHLYLHEDFRAGFAELDRRGLVFDAWSYHTQIGELADLAGAFPDTTIVLDHCGGPLGIGPYAGRQDEVFANWQQAIEELARCDNVVVKLGGLLMAVNALVEKGQASSDEVVAGTARYHHHCIASFGAERCMFESNFPVDNRGCSYAVLWNAFKKIAADYSAREQDYLFHDTAARVYRLADSP